MAKFKRGDEIVVTVNAAHPTWYTVTSATTTRVYCKFGAVGAYAGSFAMDEVQLRSEATKK